ncbi:polysaccharide pyruvyl transferase family protein [Anaerocolumna xylanovorans]|uniref:Polysaccharide pyruvyl transferase n=1 Tax=Anaerocolumna xylanovorans DSM 12503 TaxID=1121345 RepID=A0A1M7YA90_9FIRM|nr:polysaccharide pyruvyl transferase family protein [Anaerocolumna xylanovorans]SHO49527.1 Polysaccharide pyruvyl transferase [Anaerocolumna xylanovorans DSM 12503]
MKIGIITFHFAENYGAVLQCYALQEYLKSRGNEVVIINYRPKYHTIRYQLIPSPVKVIKSVEVKASGTKGRILKTAKEILLYFRDIVYIKQRYKKKMAFQNFERSYLNQTRRYSSLEELRKRVPICDIYISGSDQLWNPMLTEGKLDPAYFLDFGMDNSIRVTYAVSACQLDEEKHADSLRKLLKRLDFISLREYEKAEKIQALSNKPVILNVDPTLLHNACQYNLIRSQSEIKTPYILLMLFSKNSQKTVNEVLAEVKEEKKAEPLIFHPTVSNMKWNVPTIRPVGVGPGGYLDYIANAEFIITDSFHCTAFSIIYKKNFVTLSIEGKSSRMEELLMKLNLEERLVKTGEEVLRALRTGIQYDRPQQYLYHLRNMTDVYFNQIENLSKEKQQESNQVL